MGAEDSDAAGISIPRTDVSEEAMRAFRSEHEFTGLAVDLLIEFGSWVCLAASVLPSKDRRWTRNEAILGGLAVRLYKLVSAVLDQTCQHRRETSVMFGRMAFECLIHIEYLLAFESEELFVAFIAHSLRHERRLKERIESNIQARGGETLPIETRMLKSIASAAEVSGVRLEDATADLARPWSKVDLFQKADAVGLGAAYLSAIGGPSHSIHGSWQDLLEYHLDRTDLGFVPELEWHRPRPQMLMALGLFGVHTLRAYFARVAPDAAQHLSLEIDDLEDRFDRANIAHERFVTQRTGTKSPPAGGGNADADTV